MHSNNETDHTLSHLYHNNISFLFIILFFISLSVQLNNCRWNCLKILHRTHKQPINVEYIHVLNMYIHYGYDYIISST